MTGLGDSDLTEKVMLRGIQAKPIREYGDQGGTKGPRQYYLFETVRILHSRVI